LLTDHQLKRINELIAIRQWIDEQDLDGDPNLHFADRAHMVRYMVAMVNNEMKSILNIIDQTMLTGVDQ
jgi:hypothetical protein